MFWGTSNDLGIVRCFSIWPFKKSRDNYRRAQEKISGDIYLSPGIFGREKAFP
jgi:hypothetical protein